MMKPGSTLIGESVASLRVFAAAAAVAALALVASGNVRAQAPGQTEQPVDARTWIGHAAEIEAYLRTVQMLKFDELSVGVTKPKKAYLPEGGPMKYLAWKVIPPARYGGYWESYQRRDRGLRTRQAARTEHGAADRGEDVPRRTRRGDHVGVAVEELQGSGRHGRADRAGGAAPMPGRASSSRRRCSTT